MTLDELKTAVQSEFLNYYPLIDARQQAYAQATNGRFFQGLWTHSTFPADGVATAPDQLDMTPSDQAEPWPADVFPTAMKGAIRIDVYKTSSAWGYVCMLGFVFEGDEYTKEINFGPETSRNRDWFITPPDPI